MSRSWSDPSPPHTVKVPNPARALCLPLAACCIVLGFIAWAFVKVEGWGASAFPPFVLSVACGVTCLVLLLGTKRLIAVLVISATALAGAALSSRTDTIQPTEAHTFSCNYNTSTYIGKVRQATCIRSLQMHMIDHMYRLQQWNECMIIRSMGYNVTCGPRPTN